MRQINFSQVNWVFILLKHMPWMQTCRECLLRKHHLLRICICSYPYKTSPHPVPQMCPCWVHDVRGNSLWYLPVKCHWRSRHWMLALLCLHCSPERSLRKRTFPVSLGTEICGCTRSAHHCTLVPVLPMYVPAMRPLGIGCAIGFKMGLP